MELCKHPQRNERTKQSNSNAIKNKKTTSRNNRMIIDISELLNIFNYEDDQILS